jgi:hypothetical protein
MSKKKGGKYVFQKRDDDKTLHNFTVGNEKMRDLRTQHI